MARPVGESDTAVVGLAVRVGAKPSELQPETAGLSMPRRAKTPGSSQLSALAAIVSGAPQEPGRVRSAAWVRSTGQVPPLWAQSPRSESWLGSDGSPQRVTSGHRLGTLARVASMSAGRPELPAVGR